MSGGGRSGGDVNDRLTLLKKEITQLELLESALDQEKRHIQQSIVNVSEDPNNHKYPFICSIALGSTHLWAVTTKAKEHF